MLFSVSFVTFITFSNLIALNSSVAKTEWQRWEYNKIKINAENIIHEKHEKKGIIVMISTD